jgi:hypothetical protein
MNPFKPLVLALLAFLAGMPFARAQINFAFNFSNTGVYNANAGTKVIGSNVDEQLSGVIPIGFDFNYGCNIYTTLIASSNGFLSLGSTATDPGTANLLNSSGNGPIIAPLWDDLKTGPTGNVNYKLAGLPGSYVLTVEWLQMLWKANGTSATISFQVKLYQATSQIQFYYRQESGTVSSGSASIGINGGYTQPDLYSVTNSNTSTHNTENSVTARPANGTIYSWTPTAMTYSSSKATQATTLTVGKCELNAPIVGFQVVMGGGCGGEQSLTSLLFNMKGSTIQGTNTNDVSKIHIYYTGTSSTFSPTNEYVPGGITPATGTITASGSQPLVPGTNYFWVAYDINSSSATSGNLVDAQVTSAIIGSSSRTPSTTNPTGNRSISICPVAPGGGAGIGTNMLFWVKANAGTSTTTDAALLSSWNDQSGNNRNASASGTQPTFASNATDAVNFNPVVKFDGSTTYMTIPSNGVFPSGNNDYSVYFVIDPGTQHNTGPGKVIASGNCNAKDKIMAFDLRGTNAINDTWDMDDNISPDNVFSPDLPFLASFVYDNGVKNRTSYVNGVSVSSNTPTGTRASTDNGYSLGVRVSCLNEYFQGAIAEITSIETAPDAPHRNRVESYLSLKYGLTLGNNGSTTTSYADTKGNVIWTANTGYHYNVAGIGKDVSAEALDQRKSTSVSATPDIITVANSSITSPTTLSADGQYLIWGNNNMGINSGSPAQYIHGGPSTSIYAQLSRIWRTEKTGSPSGNAIIQVDMNKIPGPTGAGTNANVNLRLLVDNNTSFGDASSGEHTYSPDAGYAAKGGSITFTVPYSDIQSGQGFFTLGSTDNLTSPLPIGITNFSGQCTGDGVGLTWNAYTETGNTFTIEHSADGTAFTDLGTIPGGFNNGADNYYSYTDRSPFAAGGSYRIRETDADGTVIYSQVVSVSGCQLVPHYLTISPNPFSSSVTISCQLDNDAVVSMLVYNAIGQRVAVICAGQHYPKGMQRFTADLSDVARGMYILQTVINGKTESYKLIRK